MKINIGCGRKKMPDYINIDNRQEHKPDLLVNVDDGLPFADSSVDEIYTSHFIEHVNDLVETMREFHRVLKPDGFVTIIYPCYPDARVFSSPYHKYFLTDSTFHWFVDGHDPHEHPDFFFTILEEKEIMLGNNRDFKVVLKPSK